MRRTSSIAGLAQPGAGEQAAEAAADDDDVDLVGAAGRARSARRTGRRDSGRSRPAISTYCSLPSGAEALVALGAVLRRAARRGRTASSSSTSRLSARQRTRAASAGVVACRTARRTGSTGTTSGTGRRARRPVDAHAPGVPGDAQLVDAGEDAHQRHRVGRDERSGSNPGWFMHTDGSPRSRISQIVVRLGVAVVELDDDPAVRVASVSTRRCIHHVSVTGSTSRGSGSAEQPAHGPLAERHDHLLEVPAGRGEVVLVATAARRRRRSRRRPCARAA